MRSSPTSEARLLVECARADSLSPSPGSGIDWETFLWLARSHAVMPLVYSKLASDRNEAIPQPFREQLAREFEINARGNLAKAAELLRILVLLEEKGVAAVPFKGPVLAQSAFGDLSMRQFVDLDLLVPPAEVRTALDVLLRDGYRGDARALGQFDRKLENGYEFALTRPDGSIAELQWALAPRYFAPVRIGSFWRRLDEIHLGGRRVPTLAREDLLLALAVHGSKHEWEKLGWISDTARVLAAEGQADWDGLVGRARRAGVLRMVLLACALSRDLLHCDIPEVLGSNVKRDPRVVGLVREVRSRLLSGRIAGEGFPARSLHIRMRERPADRIRYVVMLAATPTEEDWDLVSLPRPLSFLYHVMRPFRLAMKYGGRALSRFRQLR